jgi:hypothetical protein
MSRQTLMNVPARLLVRNDPICTQHLILQIFFLVIKIIKNMILIIFLYTLAWTEFETRSQTLESSLKFGPNFFLNLQKKKDEPEFKT